MNDLHTYLSELCNERLYQMILSNPREKDGISRIKIRPVMVKQELMFQETCFQGTQVFHKNYQAGDMVSLVERYMEDKFRQLEAWHMEGRLHVLVSKKGRTTIKFKSTESGEKTLKPVMEHNREKHYILKEGIPVPFLIDLGVQTPEGKIVHARYDKFKQINRFLEIIDDALKNKEYKQLNIIDFGCGKSYLTFVVYYYLTEIKNIKANIIGLDLKKDVIDNCNKIAEKYGYTGIKFEVGNINGYEVKCDVDMVITLHACDTATDYALYNAIKWNTKMIFSVPCCQHELNSKIAPNHLKIIKRYGIAKERISALYTDIIRCNLLEIMGYKTKLLEFVDFENTPKNLLIRAYKSNIPKAVKDELLEEVLLLLEELNCDQTLFELLKEQLDKTENL